MTNDLIKISAWTYQLKVSFNPDVTKQAQELILPQKSKKPGQPTNASIANTNCWKYHKMYRDGKVDFCQ